jgi:hypothetical protein
LIQLPRRPLGLLKKRFPNYVLPSDRGATLFGHEMEVPRLTPRNDMKGETPRLTPRGDEKKRLGVTAGGLTQNIFETAFIEKVEVNKKKS